MNETGLAEKIYQRATNFILTSGSRFEGGSEQEAVAELVELAGGDVEVLEQAGEHCRQALDASAGQDEIRRACELLAAALDEAQG